MSDRGLAIGLAAERLIGTPYRLHGRDPEIGLDCVGLVGAALAEAGIKAALPEGYRLRRLELGAYEHLVEPAGLTRVGGAIRPGDIALARPGPGQLHLAVWGPRKGWIHAHAGLRRVSALGRRLPWSELYRWRSA